MKYEIRRAIQSDSFDIARMHIDSWKTTYRGIVSDDYLDNLSYEERERWWSERISSKTRNLFVAEHSTLQSSEKKIIGFCSGGRNRSIAESRYEAELYAIYILQNQRGKGIGKALVESLAISLIESGFSSMVVWVLAKNPYRRFYESLGGMYVRSAEIQIGGSTFEEVAYGWTDMRPLTNL
jgi:GNAT superfamily N-acetyltransferase